MKNKDFTITLKAEGADLVRAKLLELKKIIKELDSEFGIKVNTENAHSLVKTEIHD